MEERFLLFRAAGERFALKLQEVCEVMEIQPSFPLPRAPRHFLGLVNFHGTLTALVDPAIYLGRKGGTGDGKVLVLDSRAAHLALLVDGVESIIPRDAVLEERPGEDHLVSSLLETEEGTFSLLNLDTLVFALEQGL